MASEHRAWRRPRLGDLLIWTAMAVVAGAFLGLLARQTWVVALVAGTVVAIYVWRELR